MNKESKRILGNELNELEKDIKEAEKALLIVNQDVSRVEKKKEKLLSDIKTFKERGKEMREDIKNG